MPDVDLVAIVVGIGPRSVADLGTTSDSDSGTGGLLEGDHSIDGARVDLLVGCASGDGACGATACGRRHDAVGREPGLGLGLCQFGAAARLDSESEGSSHSDEASKGGEGLLQRNKWRVGVGSGVSNYLHFYVRSSCGCSFPKALGPFYTLGSHLALSADNLRRSYPHVPCHHRPSGLQRGD